MDEVEYMSVGEVAKKMNISTRTLQYYDREGILKPSGYSKGGRRLYSAKDLVLLHQVLALKRVGFRLHQIKEQILPLDSPQDTLKLIVAQKHELQVQIQNLSQALSGIEVLEKEIIKMKTVDYTKYANLLDLFMHNGDGYWVIHSMEDDLLDHVRERFIDSPDAGVKIYNAWNTLSNKIIEFSKQGVKPQDKKSMEVMDEWWEMVNEFTGGDSSLLPKLANFNEQKINWDKDMIERQEIVDEYIKEAMMAKFKRDEQMAKEGLL